jgi:hypothetical protein
MVVRLSIEANDFIFFKSFRPALRRAQPPIQWVPNALSSWVKRPQRESDHSPLSRVEVKNEYSYIATRYASMAPTGIGLTSKDKCVMMCFNLLKRSGNFKYRQV